MIYETLQDLCKERGTCFAKVEKSLGFGNGTMQKWNKALPRIDKVKSVADFFGVSVDYLLGRATISPQGQELANAFDSLSLQKRDLVKRYLEVIQKE